MLRTAASRLLLAALLAAPVSVGAEEEAPIKASRAAPDCNGAELPDADKLRAIGDYFITYVEPGSVFARAGIRCGHTIGDIAQAGEFGSISRMRGRTAPNITPANVWNWMARAPMKVTFFSPQGMSRTVCSAVPNDIGWPDKNFEYSCEKHS